MRGALSELAPLVYCPRIIPADAESTLAIVPSSDTMEDHPRGCGEHCL